MSMLQVEASIILVPSIQGLAERKNTVIKWKLCRNCLRARHKASKGSFGPCRRCPNEKHNSTLCPRGPKTWTKKNRARKQTEGLSVAQKRFCETMILVGTALVNVPIKLRTHSCRAIWDTGSQVNLITRQCAQRLLAKIKPCNRVVYGIGNKVEQILTQTVQLDIQAWHNDHYLFTAEFKIIEALPGPLPCKALPGVRKKNCAS